MSAFQEEFNLAVEVANKLPKASNEDMLEMYGCSSSPTSATSTPVRHAPTIVRSDRFSSLPTRPIVVADLSCPSRSKIRTARPGMFDMKGKAKWDAWEKCKGVSKEEAMQKYCEVIKRLSA